MEIHDLSKSLLKLINTRYKIYNEALSLIETNRFKCKFNIISFVQFVGQFIQRKKVKLSKIWSSQAYLIKLIKLIKISHLLLYYDLK